MMKFLSPTVIDSEPRGPSGVNPSPAARASRCSLRKLLLYFLRLGSLGGGGPIALAGSMHRDLGGKGGGLHPVRGGAHGRPLPPLVRPGRSLRKRTPGPFCFFV